MSASINNQMDSSNKTTKGFFRFDRYRTDIIDFDENTNMVDIYGYIYQSFNNVLPSKFHVAFYSSEARNIVPLDGNLLESENNPFRSNSINGSQEVTDILDCLQLLVLDDSSPDDQINSQSNTLYDTIASTDLVNALMIDPPSPVELNDVLLHPPVTSNSSMGVISDNNVSNNNVDDESIADDRIDDTSASENPLNAPLNSQNSITSSNEDPLAIETADGNYIQLGPLVFSHDVHPEQKHHYITNTYNLGDQSNSKNKNRGTSCLQGLKTKEEMEKGGQILPHIQISRFYLLCRHVLLLLYAVFEEEEANGTRVWFKHFHKGFLMPDQLKPNAKFVNPIAILLNANNPQWKENGIYELIIYLLTMTDKENTNTKQEIWRRDKQAAEQIHNAKHIKCSKRIYLKPTRIIGVIQINDIIFWSTACISNFIQPPNKNLPLTPSNNATTVQTALPVSTIHLNAVTSSSLVQTYEQNPPPIVLSALTAVQSASPRSKRKKM